LNKEMELPNGLIRALLGDGPYENSFILAGQSAPVYE
jgi:hypothetical protein